ncbi:MAG TPA: alpha/beta hydrolase [Bryobacteraceae bacterium]|nr:alpha/beta hydrolase [Bryobacteraceae bacterium]
MRNFALARAAVPVFSLMVAAVTFAADPQPIYLWPNGAPGSEGKTGEQAVRVASPNNDRVVSGVHRPNLIPYLPAKDTATGAAIVVAPGGGHREIWSDHEGHNIGKFLSSRGVAAFVLIYRLAREKDSTYTIGGHSLADTQRAIRLVKSRATEWNIDPERVGVMGFSAGGELAALAAAQHDAVIDGATEAIDKLSARPAFQVLVYPAIPKDMNLTKNTPPAYLVCGENDRVNISQGLPELYLAMKKAGISAELHVYAGVGHGFGQRDSLKGPVSTWLVSLRDWMDAKGFLKK